MKILITGGNGFVGANLVRYFLSKEVEVSVLVRSKNKSWRLENISREIEVFEGDITDRSSIRNVMQDASPDGVIHTAVYGGYPFQKNDEKIFETNLIGTINVVEEVVYSEAKWLINTGSSSEYGVKYNPMRETDVCLPIDSYGVSKLSGTLYCRAKAEDLHFPVFTLRLFSVYGPMEEPGRLIPHLLTSVLRHKEPELSTPNPVRDFVYIQDVCKAYYMLSQKYREIPYGETINVGTGLSSNVGNVVDVVSRIVGEGITIKWGKNGGRNSDKSKYWACDSTKIRSLLGWIPDFDLFDGLQESLGWFRENLKYYPEAT